MKRPGSTRDAFTLVELLVVIGIIAILIGVLLPALQAARRQSAQTKCSAALREIGHAIMMYSMDNKGYWPMAAIRMPDNDSSKWRSWTDVLAPYVTKNRAFTARDDIAKIRQNSPLWGCPAYGKVLDYKTNPGSSDMCYTGFGMNYLPPTYFQSGLLRDQSIITAGVSGNYAKFQVWQRNAADRLIVTDSTVEFIKIPSPPMQWSTVTIAPYDALAWNTTDFYVDGARHAKPGTRKKGVMTGKFMNILYCDGHAAGGSVVDAYNAIHNPGRNSTKP